MIGWLHAELTPIDSLIGMPTDGTAYVEHYAKPTQPAFALGRANQATPYLVGTSTSLQMPGHHSPHNSAPLMGDQPYNTIEFYFTATSFIIDVLEKALNQWRTLAPSRPKPTATTIMDRWAIFVLRTGCGLVECGIDDPLHTRHTAATRMGDWFNAPPRPNAPTQWQDARPAFLFTASSIQDSAHTRLEAAKALAEDKALLAKRLGHDGSFTWKLDGHIGL